MITLSIIGISTLWLLRIVSTRTNFFVLRLTPLENEPVTGEMRVQITFEAYKVGNAVGISTSATTLTGGMTEQARVDP